jgi:hypothetical protein
MRAGACAHEDDSGTRGAEATIEPTGQDGSGSACSFCLTSATHATRTPLALATHELRPMEEVTEPPVLVRQVVVRTQFDLLTLVFEQVEMKPPLAARSSTGAARVPAANRATTHASLENAH